MDCNPKNQLLGITLILTRVNAPGQAHLAFVSQGKTVAAVSNRTDKGLPHERSLAMYRHNRPVVISAVPAWGTLERCARFKKTTLPIISTDEPV